MVSIVVYVVAAVGVAAGPVMLAAAERATGTRLVSAPVRVPVTVVLSTVLAALWWAGWVRLGVSPAWLMWCWVCALASCLVVADLRSRRLPFSLVATLAAGAAAVMLGGALVDGDWWRMGFACGAGLALFGIGFLVQLLAPEHTGGGDTALCGAVALFLGWFGWGGLVRGLLIAGGFAMVALAVAAWSRKANVRFPAGPPLLAGALVSILSE